VPKTRPEQVLCVLPRRSLGAGKGLTREQRGFDGPTERAKILIYLAERLTLAANS
jgi:hypothetical protein